VRDGLEVADQPNQLLWRPVQHEHHAHAPILQGCVERGVELRGVGHLGLHRVSHHVVQPAPGELLRDDVGLEDVRGGAV
jgi:hypothetical protein